jgi:hypothetical protein
VTGDEPADAAGHHREKRGKEPAQHARKGPT